eukprot:jgi/Chlat1/2803/Chrsp187S02960
MANYEVASVRAEGIARKSRSKWMRTLMKPFWKHRSSNAGRSMRSGQFKAASQAMTTTTTITSAETTTEAPVRETREQLGEQPSTSTSANLSATQAVPPAASVMSLQHAALPICVVTNPSFRGRDAMRSVVIKQHASTCAAIRNFCIIMLKRPLHEFIIAFFLVPVALNLLLYPEGDFGVTLPSKLFYTALYSLSLSTFGGPLIARDSAYTFILRNLNMLMAQVMLVFLFGAGCLGRRSQ